MFLQDAFSITREEIAVNYFNRIGYNGNHEATYENLKQIHQLHPASIPFENISPLLRQPVGLDIEAIYSKLVLQHRGGYCFEHNLLMGYVLDYMGFKVRGLMARTLYNLPEGKNLFRGHMALLVETEGKKYLADTGFGGLTLTGPLLWNSTEEQTTPHEKFRLVPFEEEIIIEAQVKDDWKPLYMLGLHSTILNDYELASWYHCTHPNSRFTKRLVVALSAEDKRIALLNNQLAVHNNNGMTEKTVIGSGKELYTILKNIFKIPVTEPEASQIFEQLLYVPS